MTKTSGITPLEYTLPLSGIDKGSRRKEGKKMKERTMIMMWWGVRDEWENEAQSKTKQSATKHKVNIDMLGWRNSIDQCMTRGSKGVCRGGYVQCMINCMKNAHVGQGVLNTQPMNQTCS